MTSTSTPPARPDSPPAGQGSGVRRRIRGLRGLLPLTATAVVAIALATAVTIAGHSPGGTRPAARAAGPAAPRATATSAAGTARSGTVRRSSGGGGNTQAAAGPLPGQPLTLSVPAVGLTTRVQAMIRPASGAIDPPSSQVAYWISSYGTVGPGSTNTAYIAGHTCRGVCHAVFSPFLDIPRSATTVKPGDKVYVGTIAGTDTYTVTGTERYSKATIARDKKLWSKVPGRLALITCFQYKGGTSSQQNYIVYAQLDPSPSPSR